MGSIAGIVWAVVLGYAVLHRIGHYPSKAEAFALAYLIGVGVTTVFMFVLDIVGVPINAPSVLAFSVLLMAALYLGRLSEVRALVALWNPKIRATPPPRSDQANVIHLWFFLAIGFLFLASLLKNLYWPTIHYDSVAGYDLMAKAIAAEGKLRVSLFDQGTAGPRGIYPPLLEGSFAWMYLLGARNPKLVISFFFLALLIVFYENLSKRVNRTNAILFTFILTITPELFAHSALAMSNLPAAAYAAAAMFYLYSWLRRRQMQDLMVGAVLMALNVWVRNDGVAFNIAGWLVLAWDGLKQKTWRPLAIYSAVCFAPFAVWNVYLAAVVGIVPDRFRHELFWDPDRIKVMLAWMRHLLADRGYYGIVFYVFAAAFILNIRHIGQEKELLALLLISYLIYSFTYYQLDDAKQNPISTMMRTSFHRALFYFIPVALFYSSVARPVRWAFRQIEEGYLQSIRRVGPA